MHSPTGGSQVGAVSYERGTPVESGSTHEMRERVRILYENIFNSKTFWQWSLPHDFENIASKDHAV